MRQSALLLLLIALGLLGGVAVAVDDDAHADETVVQWDFGWLPQKAEVSHTFYVHNDGAAPEIVDKIKSGCSCTSISEITEPIPPGDSVPVTVTFKSGHYRDRVRKTTTVFCDGLDDPAYRLVIVAEVVKHGTVDDGPLIEARELEWRIEAGQWVEVSDSVPLVNRTDETLRLGLAAAARDVVEIEYPRSIAPGDTAMMILRPTATLPPEDLKWTAVTVVLAGSKTTRATIPIEIKR